MLPVWVWSNSSPNSGNSGVTHVGRVVDSESCRPSCRVPSAPVRSSTSPRLGAGQQDPPTPPRAGAKTPPGGFRSDLAMWPLVPNGLSRPMPPGPGSGIQSKEPFLVTAYLTSLYLRFPLQSSPSLGIWKMRPWV